MLLVERVVEICSILKGTCKGAAEVTLWSDLNKALVLFQKRRKKVCKSRRCG